MQKQMTPKESSSAFLSFIDCCSREQAINEGFLIDVSEIAFNRLNYKWPLALTREVWDRCVAWTERDSDQQAYQTQLRRLLDVLCMAKYGLCHAEPHATEAWFETSYLPRDGESLRAVNQCLVIAVSPGDHKEPVLTIMLPEQVPGCMS